MLSLSRLWRSSGVSPHCSSSSNSGTTPKSCLSCSAPCRLEAEVQCGHLTLVSPNCSVPYPPPFSSSIHPLAPASFSPHLNRILWVRMWSSQAPSMAVSAWPRAGAWASVGNPCNPCNTGSSTVRTTNPAYSLGMLGSSGVREEKGQDIRL